MAITVPDINQVLKQMNGPPAAAAAGGTTCAGERIVDRCRVGFLGVKPAYQHTGVAAGFYVEHFEHGRDHRASRAARWAGSSRRTRRMNRGMEAMGGEIVKKYRVYERSSLCIRWRGHSPDA